jgi:hypothetical protein
MLLSILTPSIPRRHAKLAQLARRIEPWLGHDIEWLVLVDDRPSGPKRNEMMDAAQGAYVCHIDDDDMLDEAFPEFVLPLLTGVDVVLYDAHASFNGGPQFRVHTGLDYPNEQPQHLPGGRLSDIRRRPWHWCAWRVDIARRGRFPDKHHGAEDAIWLEQVWPLAKTCAKVDRPLFIHRYCATDSAFDGPTSSSQSPR